MNFTTHLKGSASVKISLPLTDENVDRGIDWETAIIKWKFDWDCCEWGVTGTNIEIESVELEYNITEWDSEKNRSYNLEQPRVVIDGPQVKINRENVDLLDDVVPCLVEYKHGESKCEVEF